MQNNITMLDPRRPEIPPVNMSRTLIIGLLAMLLSISFPTTGQSGNRYIEKVDFDTFEPRLYKDSDSVYVINFWATWCAPCIRELPYFEKLNEVYGPEKVKVLLVNLDFPNQLESRVLPFLDRNNIKSEVIMLDDPFSNRWIPKVSEEWSGAIPATVFYNQEERLFFEKELSFEQLEEIVLSLLNK